MFPIRQNLQQTPADGKLLPFRLVCRKSSIVIFTLLAALSFIAVKYSAHLVVETSLPQSADYVALADLECFSCFRLAAERSQVGQIDAILIFATEPRRLVLLGAELPQEVVVRNKLAHYGTSQEAVQIVEGDIRSDWDTVKRIGEWLDAHETSHISFLCDKFSSRRWSLIFDRTLTDIQRSRVSVTGLSDPRYNESNWWRSRTGIKSFFRNLFRLGYAQLHGEDRIPRTDWSPQKYESVIVK